ncbi:MAG: hypothetical protein MI748_06295, partial [Opitutales bacterium]|nr:hypothetical protein [Opitutales bacterium]
WRIDDVMVSYAAQGGSVGPHYDNYDVFLIQGLGTRLWHVGGLCSGASATLDNEQLRLLADFTAVQTWLLQPGDMLYLPPLYGHWGIADSSDCMTYSIGFRAPSYSEILSDYCDDRIAHLQQELRYTDIGLPAQSNPGEIGPDAIATIRDILQQQLTDSRHITDWFGRFMTRPKYHIDATDSEDSANSAKLLSLMQEYGIIFRDPASRFAFFRDGQDSVLFVNGESYSCHAAKSTLAQLLAAQDAYQTEQLTEFLNDLECAKLLLQLLNQGSLYFDDEGYH